MLKDLLEHGEGSISLEETCSLMKYLMPKEVDRGKDKVVGG